MTRKAFPYTPFDKSIQPPGPERVHYPMDAPYLEFRNHYNTPSETRRGEIGNTHGSLDQVVPIEAVYSTGPDTARGASRRMTGGVVRGYMIESSVRVAILVSRNLFSPTSHPNPEIRCRASATIPPKNAIPTKDIGMPPKMGKRGTGGKFTIPAPQVVPSWPTSAEWLRSRFSR